MVDKDDLDFKIELESDRDAAPTSLNNKQYLQQQRNESEEMRGSKVYPKFLEGSAHPGFCMLHLAFKTAAILCYILLGLFVRG